MKPKNKNKEDPAFPDRESHFLLEHIRNTYSQFEDKLIQLSILRELGVALLYINDFKRVCQTILDIIIKNTVAKNCSIMLMDHDQDRLFLIAATNPDGESFIIDVRRIFSKDDVQYTFASGEGNAGEAVAKKELVLIEDVDRSNIYTSRGDTKVTIGTLLSAPLIIEDSVLGVLNLSHPVKRAFEPNDVNLFNIVANFVALAINSTLNYERLQYSEEKYRALTQYSNDGITIIEDGMHKYANPSYESLTGYSFNELTALPFDRLVSFRHGAENEAQHGFLRNRDIPGTYEAVMTSKSGRKTEIETSHAPFLYEGQAAEIISVRDVSERKRLENQLRQAQKMEAVGTLGSGIAHDFNNLLMGIQGNLSLMLMDMDSTHPYYGRLKNIEKQVHSGARLTSHLLGYARKGKYEVQPIDLNELVKETSETFGRTRKQITIHRELAEDLSAVEADREQIERVLWNLYVNASDAMPTGGDLVLKTTNTTYEHMRDKSYHPKSQKYVLLTLTDTGMGMDKKTRQRVFDPFFTTKERGRGSGLGLASAYGIIKSHCGYIDVDSKSGHGTTFSIYLPASEKKVQKTVKATERVIKGTGIVLLVDDEEAILQVAQELLEAMGYRVLLARNGREAVEAYRKNQDDIDIVLLDIVMPNMGGAEAYDLMKQINPNIKVLLSSGYSINSEATKIIKRGCDAFIQKPFTMKELSRKIREILDKK
jgi:two-component system cell cycle sensor histidine kinase/response regulator CckA